MKTLNISFIAVCASLALSSASFADGNVYEMPSEYFDGLNAKLIHAGYHGLRVVDQESNRLVGYDSSGSEVVLIAHPSNYTIVSATYVHHVDH